MLPDPLSLAPVRPEPAIAAAPAGLRPPDVRLERAMALRALAVSGLREHLRPHAPAATLFADPLAPSPGFGLIVAGLAFTDGAPGAAEAHCTLALRNDGQFDLVVRLLHSRCFAGPGGAPRAACHLHDAVYAVRVAGGAEPGLSDTERRMVARFLAQASEGVLRALDAVRRENETRSAALREGRALWAPPVMVVPDPAGFHASHVLRLRNQLPLPIPIDWE